MWGISWLLIYVIGHFFAVYKNHFLRSFIGHFVASCIYGPLYKVFNFTLWLDEFIGNFIQDFMGHFRKGFMGLFMVYNFRGYFRKDISDPFTKDRFLILRPL